MLLRCTVGLLDRKVPAVVSAPAAELGSSQFEEDYSDFQTPMNDVGKKQTSAFIGRSL
jgi:hypothetical protein